MTRHTHARVARRSDRLLFAICLFLAAEVSAEAYIDPGTGSLIFAVGLAPILAFFGLLGRRIVRIFMRSNPEEEGEADNDEGTDDSED